jgi:predicted P-loop ATPase/GTPase
VLIEEKQRVTEEKQHVIEEKQRVTEEKQHVIEEKQRVIEEKQHVIEEKQRVIEEKQRVIEAKDDMIVAIKESSDIAKALAEIVQKPKLVQKWGERVHVFHFFNMS